MKTLKKLLLFWMFIPMFSVVLAQPANDNCATATNLGTLPTPSACSGGSGGVGAAVTATGTTNAATAANPYTYLLGCQGGGDQPAPALDVWYSFVASGNEVVINITPNGTSFLANPAITLWRGSCGSLIGQGCKLGTAAGNNSFTFGPTTPGQTYYIQISGNNMTSTGNFNLSVKNNNDCTACNITSNLVATPAPTNGTYPPNTSVTFCYTISNWATTSANWLHGVIPSFGCGWDLTTLTPGTPPAVIGGSGTWKWYNSVTSQATGQTFGKGFYIDKGGDNNPGNNFGDNGTGTWTFCWTIKTKPVSACSGGCKDLSMSINTTGDGESGSWTSLACVNDPDFPFSAMLACCTTTAAGTNPSCGGNDGTATATPVTPSTPPYTYSWNTAPVQTSQTATGLPAGTYTVTVTDNNGCKSTANAVLTSGAMPTVNAGADVTICNGNSTTLTATASTGGGTYTWSPATGLSGTTGATVTASPTSTQTYTVTYTNGPCTATDQVIVTVTSKVTPTFNPIPAFCNGTTAPTLPPTSTNGITGTWSPATVSNTASGTYNFTPSAGQCANTTSISITVTPKVTPTFNPIPAFCNGTTAPTLPTTSTNGISGTWSPATVSNTASGTYNFTPSAGQCANPTSISITVNPLPTPSITPVSPLCVDAAAVTLVGTPSGGTFSGPGVTGTNFNPATAGTGTKTITYNYTDGNGCTASTTTTITVKPKPTFTVSSTNPSICGGTDGTITISGLTASTSYSVSYDKGATTVGPTAMSSNASGTITISGLGAGSYSNFVVTLNGCSTTVATPQTLVDPSAPTVNAGADVSICDGNSTTLTATPSIGGGTFTWGPATGLSGTTGATVTASPTTTQTYTVTYVRSGCTATDQVIVTVTPKVTPTFNPIPAFCNGTTAPTLPPTSTNGISGTWSPATVSNTASGTYNFTPSAGQCANPTSISITVNPLPTPSITPVSPLCVDAAAVTLVGTPSGGTFSGLGVTGTNFNPATAGTGTKTITYNYTDGNGCQGSATTTITVNPTPTFTVASTNPSVCGGTDGSIILSGLTASTSYSVTYNAGATTVGPTNITSNASGTITISGLGAGSYSNFVVSQNGCSTTIAAPQTLVDPSAPTVNAGTDVSICDGNSTTLTATPSLGGGTFTWSPATGLSGTTGATVTASPTATQTYTVTYVRSGCTTTDQVIVTINPLPTPSITAVAPLCEDAAVVSLVGTPSGAGGVFSGAGVSGTNFNPATAGVGTHTITYDYTDANGCFASTTTSITVKPKPIFTVTSTSPTVCAGTDGTVTLNGLTPSTSYSVSYENGATTVGPTTMTSNGAGSIVINGLSSGTYSNFTVDLNGCVTTVATPQVLIDPSAPTVNAGIDQTICSGTSVTLTATNPNGATISWDNGIIDGTAFTPAVGTITYTVTASLAGCTATDQVIVTINPLPTPSITTVTPLCEDAAVVSLVGTPSGAGGVFSGAGVSGTNFNPANAGVGTHTITYDYTDANGCFASTTTSITVKPKPIFTVSSTSPTVCAGTDGTVTLNGLTPSTSYSVSYENGATTVGPTTMTSTGTGSIIINSLSSGTYSNFTVDLNGCVTTVATPQVLIDPSAPTVNAGIDQTICSGTSVTLTATNPNGATISWSNGVTDGTAFTPAVGTITYTVTATLAGCITTDQVIVTVNPLPTPSITTVAPLCEDAAVVSLVGTPSGAGGVFSGAGVSGTNFNPATAGVGTHTITYNYTDGNGCFASTTTTITVKPKPVFTVSSSNPTLCLGTDGVVTLSGLTGNTSYSVSYVDDGTTVGPTNITSNAAGNILLTGLNAGTYSNFTVDLNGCITTVATPQVLVDPSAPVVNAGIDQTVCQGTSVTLTATNPNGATISWSNGVTDGTAFTPAVGTITYTVTAILAGCTTTDQVDVTVNPMPNASSIGTTTVCQGAGDQTITFTGQNSSANYTFSYTVNGGTSQTVTSSSSSSATVIQSSAVPGTYIYQLTNVSDPTTGCNQTLNEVETIIVKPLPIASISNPVQACHLDTNLPQVVFTGSNGDTPYTFTYTINGGSNLSATSDASGVFTIQNPTNTVGTFTYTITAIKEGSVNGCQQIQNEQTVITIHALPNVNAGNDQTVCAGTTVILQGAGASTYDWDNGVFNGNSFVPTSTTTYTVIGTDNNGCKNTDQVIVNVVPIPVVNFDGINLNGCNPISPTLFNHSTGNLTNCKWYLGNGQVVDGCTSITATFDSPGCYDVTLEVSTPEGCSNSLTMQDYICVYPQPIAEFHPTHTELTSYQWTSQMVNESLNADTYKWTFDDDTAPSYEFSPVHQFPNESSGVYTIQLIASNSYGCADTTTRQIKMADDLLFFIPNTFTPDGDQHNNVFQPVFSHGFDPYDYTLYIFNRWGEIVFESHDATIGWDGSYGVGGQLCPDGTYTWKIEVKTTANDERKMFTGHVNIIR